MKVQFIGELNVELFAKKLLEIADSTIERVEKEHGVKINDYKIHEADVVFKFDVEGMDEPQLLTVEHHKGHPEVFTWIVDTEKEQEVNNEHESLYDEWTVAKAQGKEHEFKEIESHYKDEVLELEEFEEFGDMARKVFKVKGKDFKVIQVFQKDKLIQEIKLVPKAKEQA